jgi:hypothetical protein
MMKRIKGKPAASSGFNNQRIRANSRSLLPIFCSIKRELNHFNQSGLTSAAMEGIEYFEMVGGMGRRVRAGSRPLLQGNI